MVKDISGLESSRSAAAPDQDELANCFAEKMTSGKDDDDNNFAPNSPHLIPLSNFRIRFKSVRNALRKLDPNKSANGVGPRFLRKCANTLAPLACGLFKFVVRKSTVPPGWKLGRITPVHKRGSVSTCSNYRPVTVIDNLEGVFEGVTKSQLEAWITRFIPDWQYGFLSDHGTVDYGAAMSLTLQDCLERR